MNLIIDIGNTFKKTSLIENKNIIKTDIHSELSIHHLKNIISAYPSINKAIISTVTSFDMNIKEYLTNSLPYFLEMNDKIQLPVEILYKTRSTLGYDRIASVIGANNIYPSCNVLVIDAGTAITYDFINAQNQYVGGNISPGMQMRFKALHTYTKQLPLHQPQEFDMLTGDSTSNAIHSGVQKGIVFEIERYIHEYRVKYPDIKIVIIGGDANYFDKKLKNSIFVNLNLVTIGLNRILEYNAGYE